MSWSRSYSGTANGVTEAANADQGNIEATLPEFERADVAKVIGAAAYALQALPEGASVSLTINGHGWRDSAGGGGGLGVSISYSLVTEAQSAN